VVQTQAHDEYKDAMNGFTIKMNLVLYSVFVHSRTTHPPLAAPEIMEENIIDNLYIYSLDSCF
jgi:hypothetical protein